MRLSEICVERPVFAFMLVMFLVVLGVSSFAQLGVDLFPRSDAATVNVKVELPGASPEEVTSQVVMPLEEAIASVSGLDEMRRASAKAPPTSPSPSFWNETSARPRRTFGRRSAARCAACRPTRCSRW